MDEEIPDVALKASKSFELGANSVPKNKGFE